MALYFAMLETSASINCLLVYLYFDYVTHCLKAGGHVMLPDMHDADMSAT